MVSIIRKPLPQPPKLCAYIRVAIGLIKEYNKSIIGRKDMEYNKKADLKVECIASEEDFEFFGITLDDVLDRTPAGFNFLKKVKELCAITQKVTWTNVAYTLNIGILQDGRVSFEFSECLDDYIAGLKNSVAMADDKTIGPMLEFIAALEGSDEESGRRMVARFEKNIRNERN
jgi:hypothetical protein